MKRKVSILFITLPLSMVLIAQACAPNRNTSVNPTLTSTPYGRYHSYSISPGATAGLSTAEVPPGGSIKLHFTVSGGSNSDIIFEVTAPEGSSPQSPIKVYYFDDYVSVCPSGGRYQFTWDNRFDQVNAKVVEASYEVLEP